MSTKSTPAVSTHIIQILVENPNHISYYISIFLSIPQVYFFKEVKPIV